MAHARDGVLRIESLHWVHGSDVAIGDEAVLMVHAHARVRAGTWAIVEEMVVVGVVVALLLLLPAWVAKTCPLFLA